jgi:hypothetical protein
LLVRSLLKFLLLMPPLALAPGSLRLSFLFLLLLLPAASFKSRPREGVPLIGRLAIPIQRRRIVLRRAPAVAVHVPEIELSAGVALIGRFAIPI